VFAGVDRSWITAPSALSAKSQPVSPLQGAKRTPYSKAEITNYDPGSAIPWKPSVPFSTHWSASIKTIALSNSCRAHSRFWLSESSPMAHLADMGNPDAIRIAIVHMANAAQRST
jgi:hypothetical protein